MPHRAQNYNARWDQTVQLTKRSFRLSPADGGNYIRRINSLCEIPYNLNLQYLGDLDAKKWQLEKGFTAKSKSIKKLKC